MTWMEWYDSLAKPSWTPVPSDLEQDGQHHPLQHDAEMLEVRPGGDPLNVAVATRIRLLEEECAMSPAEAISRVNHSVVVEMAVQRTKRCTGSRQVFLDSESNHRDTMNLGVVVTEDGRGQVQCGGDRRPSSHTIRARPSGFMGW